MRVWTSWPWHPKAWVCAIFVHILVTLGLTTTANSQEISDRNLIDESRLELHQNQFKLRKNGKFSEGMIRAPDDPIDYSLLLNDEILQEFFEQTALGCNPSTHYCDDYIYRWTGEDFRLKFFQERRAITAENVSLLDNPHEYVLAATGISSDFVTELELANLVIYLGSLEYLWHKARQNIDTQAIRYFEEIIERRDDASVLQIILGGTTPEASCYTSNKNRSSKGVSIIYLTPAGLTTCYGSALLEVVDLHPTDLNVPSVTDKKNTYQGLTYFDVFAFRLLNKGDAPLPRDLNAIRALWSGEAMKLRAQLDQEILLNQQSSE